jgi:hypothetical protein
LTEKYQKEVEMTFGKFNQIVKRRLAACVKTLVPKGKEYSRHGEEKEIRARKQSDMKKLQCRQTSRTCQGSECVDWMYVSVEAQGPEDLGFCLGQKCAMLMAGYDRT